RVGRPARHRAHAAHLESCATDRVRAGPGRRRRPRRDRVDVGRVRGERRARQGPPRPGGRPRRGPPPGAPAVLPGEARRRQRLARARERAVGLGGPPQLGATGPGARGAGGGKPAGGRDLPPRDVRPRGRPPAGRLRLALTGRAFWPVTRPLVTWAVGVHRATYRVSERTRDMRSQVGGSAEESRGRSLTHDPKV